MTTRSPFAAAFALCAALILASCAKPPKAHMNPTTAPTRHFHPSASAEEALLIGRHMDELRNSLRYSVEVVPQRALTADERSYILAALPQSDAPDWFAQKASQHNWFEGMEVPLAGETPVGTFYPLVLWRGVTKEKKSWLSRIFPSTYGKGPLVHIHTAALLFRITEQGAEPIGHIREATVERGGLSGKRWGVMHSVQLAGVQKPGVIVTGINPSDPRFDQFYYYEVP